MPPLRRLLLFQDCPLSACPDLAGGGGNPAVLRVREFQAHDVAAQRCRFRHGNDPCPVSASIGRMIKGRRSTARPDVGSIRGYRSEHRSRGNGLLVFPGLPALLEAIASSVSAPLSVLAITFTSCQVCP